MPRSDRSTSWVLRLWLVVARLRRRHRGPVLPGRHPAARPARRDPAEPRRADRGHLRRARRHRRGAADAAPPEPSRPWPRPCAAVDGAPAAARGRRAARLPRRLLLLPQPEELGRLQPAPRTRCCSRGTGGSSSATARPCCCTTCWVSTSRRTSLLVVYESFSTIVSISFVAAVVLTDRIRDGYVFIASMVCVWILGVATLLRDPVPRALLVGARGSSPGLPHTMIQDTQARYLAQRAHLLAHPQAHDAFAQVSAFASLHVAVTCVILLMVRYYRLRRTHLRAAVLPGRHRAGHDLPRLALRRRRRGGRADRRRLGGDRQTAGLSTIGRTRAPSEHAGRRRHGRPRAVDRRQLVQFVGFALRSPRGCPMVGCGSYRPAHESTQNRPSGGRRDRHGRARPGDPRISHHVDGSGGGAPEDAVRPAGAPRRHRDDHRGVAAGLRQGAATRGQHPRARHPDHQGPEGGRQPRPPDQLAEVPGHRSRRSRATRRTRTSASTSRT